MLRRSTIPLQPPAPTAPPDAPRAPAPAPPSLGTLAFAEKAPPHPTRWEALPERLRRNERKFIILRILTHFWAVPMTPREIAAVYWDSLTPDERASRRFELEVIRMEATCARLASRTQYDTGVYLTKRVSKRGPVYRLAKKGDRVRRKIASGSLPGWSPVVDRLPGGPLHAPPAPAGT